MLGVNQTAVLVVSFVLVLTACGFSGYLIRSHLKNFSQPHIQSKIVGIVYMVPIYSIDSFLCLVWPAQALYIDMLRDCYEAYVLYLFLSLLLSYLGCADDDYEVATYLATKLAKEEGEADLMKGKLFLRRCKFGTLQYCVIRPLTAVLAICLHAGGVYNEEDYSLRSSHLYLLLLDNISVFYAFVSLMSFYTALKSKLYPFQPVGKFLCIKFVIFFAFWQSVVLSIAASFDVLSKDDSVALQNLLIVVEMTFVSVAHLYTFPYEPFSWAHHYNNNLNGYHVESYNVSGNGKNSRKSYLITGTSHMTVQSSNNSNSSKQSRSSARFTALSTAPNDHAYNISSSHSTSDQRDFEDSGDEYEEEQIAFANPLHGHKAGTGYKPVTFNVETLQSTGQGGGGGGLGTESSSGREYGYHPHRPSHLYHQRHIEAPPISSSNANQSGRSLAQTLDRHFATSTAVRDFNDSMPVLTLPTGFKPEIGRVLRSDPASRLQGKNNNNNNSNSYFHNNL